MKTLGYGYVPVTAKQFSHIDYFLEEEEIEKNISRTSIAWFSRCLDDFPVISSICRPEDLAHYRTISSESLKAYITKYYPQITSSQYDQIVLSNFQ